MPKKNSVMAHTAWNTLRFALLWARKGRVFKRRIRMELRLVTKLLRSSHGDSTPRNRLHYLEREMSFDKTPIIHVKMHRPASLRFHLPSIPCINPQVDFEYDLDCCDGEKGRSVSLVKNGDDDEEGECGGCDEIGTCEDEGIDRKAEEFIARFYEQMKLQRQISYLHCSETPDRGTS